MRKGLSFFCIDAGAWADIIGTDAQNAAVRAIWGAAESV